MAKQWGGLRPEQVTQWINFDAQDSEWRYVLKAPPSMASQQTEGVAHLWNLLSRHGVALLADEVGMGKTFQALGVAALLWRMKPDAKVLVMAPNRDICAHWKRELTAFVRFHYREADERVKASGSGRPVPEVEFYSQLRDLAAAIECRATQAPPTNLYLTTIRSLSLLVDATDQQRDKLATAKRAAREMHERILSALDNHGFDLVIVDEAHYFRNPQGGSQRAAAAKEFFGQGPHRIAQRALLLTATPSHTNLRDVANILSYFIGMDEAARNQPAEELMRKYALRRFRIMAGNGVGYMKHQYRREEATPCDFAGRPEAEMFFALYQRRLIHDLGVLDEKRRVLYGFLEGFESAGVPVRTLAAQEREEDQPQDECAKDFSTADDTQLLRGMSMDYRGIFGHAPDHPKYGRLVMRCAPQGLFPMAADRELHEDKHLVFVRRIPSVRELTKRINEHYDRLLAQEICAAWDLSMNEPRIVRWERQHWSRDGFNELMQALVRTQGAIEYEDVEEDEGETHSREVDGVPQAQNAYLGSKIADLFVTKRAKDNEPPSPPTDCSRFSLNLRKTTSIHAMFMEPASDYMAAGYLWHYEFRQGDKPRPDYTKAALARRLSTHGMVSQDFLESLAPNGAAMREYDEPIETLWSLVFPLLDASRQARLRRWAAERPDIAENFGNYIKAGFLFASPVVVELYGWHTRFQRSIGSAPYANVQARYRDFVAYARQRIAGSLLLRYFAAALDSFEQLCDKIIDHPAGDWRAGWRTLTALSSPAWYASGDSSHRQHLILGFNSPFYPNTLVATSVFQEGVNLHLQCRKVHHYGIAWTPGDNEQRVGRVDRLFSKVNYLLKESGPEGITLDINYPYLKDSFDEDQVGSFIERKYAVEEKMDRCTQGTFEKQVRMTRPGWHEFLRQPIVESLMQHPYPARFNDEDIPRGAYPGAD
ncbi:SNF2-related protein [Paraburkholderia kururiensis]|uniref:DEAD/DEAH box helicase family protein n=1 Tax=Paraburkholderia kururiensis TaxID=984307 RepID=A0ABZ0WG14_9BURK|nr:SNF2-related protein [Paraburkholderia kururiensis]WQD76296.1 DEAD/DEAH box helicase family protein [Paraburkholderia kururiensis]